MIRLNLRKGILLFVLLVFQLSSLTYANNMVDLPTTRINPGNFYYNFKRLWEKTFEYLNFSTQSKISFNNSLMKTRLAELKYLVDNKILSEVENGSKRFAYQAGVLTDSIIKQKNQEIAKKTIGEFQKYSKLLEILRDKYPANSSFWMLLQHDINTLNILSERLRSF